MFEKRNKRVDFKRVSTFVLTAAIVFGCGFYIGTSYQKGDLSIQSAAYLKQKTEKPFRLDKHCQVWIENDGETETNYKRTYIMAGIVPDEALNKNKQELTTYYKNEYPDKVIKSITEKEIILSDPVKSNKLDTMSNEKTGKYTFEVKNGYLALYRYDNNDKKTLVEDTKVKVESLPKTVQDQIKKGMIMNSKNEAYSKLEDFAS